MFENQTLITAAAHKLALALHMVSDRLYSVRKKFSAGRAIVMGSLHIRVGFCSLVNMIQKFWCRIQFAAALTALQGMFADNFIAD